MASIRTLRTQRLELRPIERGDADALWPFVSDPELPRLMTWEAHQTRAETVAFVELMMNEVAAGRSFLWTIRFEEALVGLVGLHDHVRTLRAWRVDRAELGYWCGAAVRNRGLTTEAAAEVLRFGFEELALHKIVVGCASENLPSRRVIEKLGFRLIGEQRDHFFRHGRWWSHLAYELLAKERPGASR